MISVEGYLKATDTFKDNRRGGQELLLGEIVGAFVSKGCKRVWLPYPTPSLSVALCKCGISQTHHKDEYDGVYFGTPTIVDNKPLFTESTLEPDRWTKDYERKFVRNICNEFSHSCKIVVSGLGSGDISVEERIEDMGEGAKVIAFKMFEDFSDWVIAKEIK